MDIRKNVNIEKIECYDILLQPSQFEEETFVNVDEVQNWVTSEIDMYASELEDIIEGIEYRIEEGLFIKMSRVIDDLKSLLNNMESK